MWWNCEVNIKYKKRNKIKFWEEKKPELNETEYTGLNFRLY